MMKIARQKLKFLCALRNYQKITCANKHVLSKTTFNYGMQCIKQLYLHKHHKRLKVDKEEFTNFELQIMESGRQVGSLARSLFPGGIDCSPESYFKMSESISKTRSLIGLKMPVLYEAAFEASDVVVAVDILKRDEAEGKWHMFEVKSSTRVKPEHIYDAALQYYVIRASGIPLSTVNVVHIDRDYFKRGTLDVLKLFKVVNITPEVIEMQDSIASNIDRFKVALSSRNVPVVDAGPHCSSPYSCKFKEHCFSQLNFPDTCSILDLKNAGEKKWTLVDQGMKSTLDIPSNFPLSSAQAIQVACDKSSDKIHVDKPQIKEFLAQLRYPIFFMDFETIAPGIPVCDDTRPYEQVCFQYSLHVQDKVGGCVSHNAFLADDETWSHDEEGENPQLMFIRSLIEHLDEGGCHKSCNDMKGTILVYNKSFEDGRLKDLSIKYPMYAPAIDRIRKRLVDLAKPFQALHVYKSSMRGSYSLKNVLPAMVPSFSNAYEDLAISFGGEANVVFRNLLKGSSGHRVLKSKLPPDADHTSFVANHKKQRDKLRKNLMDYCALDTMAMVKILEELYHLDASPSS